MKRTFFALLLAAAPLVAGCTLPKIVVLHDPLSADEHVRLGVIYRSEGKTALARDQFREATRQDRTHALAWALLGEASLQLDETAEARRAYSQAVELDPGNGDLRNNLAWVHVQQNEDLDKAQELVERAMELTPAHTPYYLDTLGVIQLMQGKAAVAAETLKRSVGLIPPEQSSLLAEAYLHLAEALAAIDDQEGAREARLRHQQLTDRATEQAPLP